MDKIVRLLVFCMEYMLRYMVVPGEGARISRTHKPMRVRRSTRHHTPTEVLGMRRLLDDDRMRRLGTAAVLQRTILDYEVVSRQLITYDALLIAGM